MSNEYTKAAETAAKLHAYMTFRSALERLPYTVTEDLYTQAIRNGIRSFFGVELSEAGDLVEDAQNPVAFIMFASRARRDQAV